MNSTETLRPVTRWLWFAVLMSFLCSAWAIGEVMFLTRKLQRVTATDMIVVPTRIDTTRATAGIAPSQNNDDLTFWMGRLDSNAQIRMTLRKDGSQNLEFFDKRGKPRLILGLDDTGSSSIRTIDEKGQSRSVAP